MPILLYIGLAVLIATHVPQLNKFIPLKQHHDSIAMVAMLLILIFAFQAGAFAPGGGGMGMGGGYSRYSA